MSELVVEVPEDRIHGDIVYSHEEVRTRARELAVEIASDYAKVQSDLLVVPFLNGAVPFANMLQEEMSAIGFKPEFAPIHISTRDENNNEVPPRLLSPLPREIFVAGRHYLDVDDMAHTGTTMAFFDYILRDRKLIKDRLRSPQNLKYLAHVAMIEREEQSMVEVDYHAFWTRLTDWLVGVGLDDQRLAQISTDCGRYLKHVYKALTKEQLIAVLIEFDVPIPPYLLED